MDITANPETDLRAEVEFHRRTAEEATKAMLVARANEQMRRKGVMYDRCRQLVAQGHKITDVAKILNVGRRTVQRAMRNDADRVRVPAAAFAEQCGVQARTMYEAGASIYAIAKTLGASRSTVDSYLRAQLEGGEVNTRNRARKDRLGEALDALPEEIQRKFLTDAVRTGAVPLLIGIITDAYLED